MYRTIFLIGFGYLAICGAVVLRARAPRPPLQPLSSGQLWFQTNKPLCNAVEVVIAQRNRPAPQNFEGQAYSAACYALGGRIDSARAVIDRLPSSQRHQAAGVVFDVAHPVADAGDDRSAGPIMEMVVDYWPNHYMALYHAGMAEFALGQSARAAESYGVPLVLQRERRLDPHRARNIDPS